MGVRLVELRLTQVRTDGGTQSRARTSQEVVLDYAAHLRAGGQFPPVRVFRDQGGTYWLARGFHRYFAHREARRKTIICEAVAGELRDAILDSVGDNTTHGLRRTNEDKRFVVRLLLRDPEWAKWSDREIARRCAVGHPLVADERRLLAEAARAAGASGSGFQMRQAERNGTTYVMDTAAIGGTPGPRDWAGEEAAALAGRAAEVRSLALEQFAARARRLLGEARESGHLPEGALAHLQAFVDAAEGERARPAAGAR